MGLKGLGRIRPVVITYMIQVTMETMITSIDYEAATVPDTLHSLFPSLPAAHWSGRYYCYFYICRLVTRDFKNFNNLPNTMHVKISMSKLAYKNIPCQWIRKQYTYQVNQLKIMLEFSFNFNKYLRGISFASQQREIQFFF